MLLVAVVLGIALGAAGAWLILRSQYASRLAAIEAARGSVETTIKALAAEALRQNNEQFLDAATSRLGQNVKPIEESLKRMTEEVNLLERARRQDYGALAKSVETLVQTNERVRAETASLATALRSSEVRGAWGQMQLRNAVETAGMLAYCDFDEEVHVASEGRSLRPDMVVRLPGGRKVVIDAKTPLKPLLDAMHAPEDERERHLDDYIRHVRLHARQLGEKAYWEQFGKDSPDYVFMFLPGEGFYRTAVERDPSLLQVAGGQRVIVVSPMTLITVLRTIACIWSDARVAESAEKVSELGRDLYDRLVTMTQHLGKLGTKLNGAVADYNQTIGSFERRVLPSARKFTEHGITPKKELPELEPVEIAAQPPQTVELPIARDAA